MSNSKADACDRLRPIFRNLYTLCTVLNNHNTDIYNYDKNINNDDVDDGNGDDHFDCMSLFCSTLLLNACVCCTVVTGIAYSVY